MREHIATPLVGETTGTFDVCSGKNTCIECGKGEIDRDSCHCSGCLRPLHAFCGVSASQLINETIFLREVVVPYYNKKQGEGYH